MSNSLRDVLTHYGYDNLRAAAQHPGLWFERYLENQPQRGKPLQPYNDLVERCAGISEPAAYASAYNRWRDSLQEIGIEPIVARSTYRLAAGHGRESVIETGIALHHTYGVPTIPGSSLKGVAGSYAAKNLANWPKNSQAYKEMFGTTDLSGYVTFFDALPVPGKWQLLPDTITVHHTDYYQGNQPPGDWDDPTPIPFLSAVGSFLIAVHAPGPEGQSWVDAAYGILRLALADVGVGGKTSSGYGRLDM